MLLHVSCCECVPACCCCAGTNSYVLFTLDKLIYKLVKQFQALLVDELAQVGPRMPAATVHAPLTPAWHS
jgi:hypothetical protein